ncbi:vWA domain-containing protein [Pseudomonas sp.]|jgi:Ca-activated chloride channel homolog|uniref:vWA domain-containing protein n=1 Tax=Pseudomonas sp. TaxID=306 RepID=UPI00272C89F9|nr:VWA domain-containing protein [Pseudomonas sp.]
MFEFLWPGAFLLLPLPWLMRRLLPGAAERGAALQVAFMARLQALEQGRRKTRNRAVGWPLLAIWLLLVSAAARPTWLGEPLPMTVTGRDMMIAVDLSGSMEARDMQLDGRATDRLSVVKRLLGEFIDERHGDRLGLILFGSQAYVQAPLTHDRETVRLLLEESFIGLPGRTTAIGDAIGLAIKRLQDQPAEQRVLLLLTDGANNSGRLSPLQAARLAATLDIRIYPIGVGSEASQAGAGTGTFVIGEVDPSLELDEGTLREIATVTGGQYFRAGETDDFVHIHRALGQLEPALRDSGRRRLAEPLYPWPLGGALLASVLLIGWRASRDARRTAP